MQPILKTCEPRKDIIEGSFNMGSSSPGDIIAQNTKVAVQSLPAIAAFYGAQHTRGTRFLRGYATNHAG